MLWMLGIAYVVVTIKPLFILQKMNGVSVSKISFLFLKDSGAFITTNFFDTVQNE